MCTCACIDISVCVCVWGFVCFLYLRLALALGFGKYRKSFHLRNSSSYINSNRKNNIRKGITTPMGHIPVPEGPFKHLCIDYVDMITPVRGKRYMLVIFDRFSR